MNDSKVTAPALTVEQYDTAMSYGLPRNEAERQQIAAPARPVKDYRITFGVHYAEAPHPRMAWAHPDGWLTIEARTEPEAREAALQLLDVNWCACYSPADYLEDSRWDRWFPRGELGRFRVGEGWISGGAS